MNDASPIPSSRSGAGGRLLGAKLLVAELLERDSHRLRVVARVVEKARRRLVRELVRLNEVVEPELRRVDAELVRGVVDEALDQVRGLGDAERAAVRDAAGRLVRVVAVGDDVRGRDVVRAGHDVEEPCLHLRRLRVGEERALVGEERRAQAGHLPVLHRQLAAHVVVTRESGRDEVARPVLHPLHRPADEQRRGGGDDVPGVDRHLVPEAAPMSGLMIRILCSGRPATIANSVRWACGACDVM